MFSRAHLRYSEKPEVNAFLAKFTTRCYNSLLVNGFWRSGPGAAPVYEDRSGERREEGGLAASRLQLRFF
jgi:hypothetical protein